MLVKVVSRLLQGSQLVMLKEQLVGLSIERMPPDELPKESSAAKEAVMVLTLSY
jgi:hypothetical protein